MGWNKGGLLILIFLTYVASLPVVDKGVFVITGVKTCREGYGYCILGSDCTVDKEFIPDDLNGHCEGLKKAFTPRAFFVCCQSLENSTISTTTTSTTTTSTTPSPPSLEEDDEADSSPSSTSDEDSASKASASIESAEVILGNGTVAITPAPEMSVVEEVHTEISVSENFHVVVGDPQGAPVPMETSSTVTEIPSTTTSTTTTTTPVPTTVTTTTTTTTTSTTTATPVVAPPACGYKATFYSAAGLVNPNNHGSQPLRIDGSRLAAQQTSLVCWTGAIVRSPSSLTLQDPGSFICTGALISEEFLLTTATCVSRLFAQDLSLFKVALGSRHLVHPMNGPTPDATYKDIVQLIVHEDYNIQGLFKRVNDIALVRLATTSSVRTDESARSSSPYCTVCLPDGEEDHSGEDCIVTGFSHPTGSATSVDEVVASGGLDTSNTVPSAHDTDGILHEADQRIEYATNCEVQLTNFTVAQNTLLRNDLNIEQSKLVCASGKFNAEACFSPRDAGSPLACAASAASEQYKLVGVFSSGFHCGTTSSPVLYTDVSKFVGWVKKNMVEGDKARG